MLIVLPDWLYINNTLKYCQCNAPRNYTYVLSQCTPATCFPAARITPSAINFFPYFPFCPCIFCVKSIHYSQFRNLSTIRSRIVGFLNALKKGSWFPGNDRSTQVCDRPPSGGTRLLGVSLSGVLTRREGYLFCFNFSHIGGLEASCAGSLTSTLPVTLWTSASHTWNEVGNEDFQYSWFHYFIYGQSNTLSA